MSKLKDSSLTKVKEYKKYKDLYDFTSLECRTALVIAVLLTGISVYITLGSGANYVANFSAEILNTICIALIGFLGFIVTGLAILTSAISNRLFSILKRDKKIKPVESILMSFYWLGLVSAFTIVCGLIICFVAKIEKPSIAIINYCLIFAFSYVLTFIVMCSVKLIGNCLELFVLINEMEALANQTTVNTGEKYSHYRVMAMEWLLLQNKNVNGLIDYKNKVSELIEKDEIPEDEKVILRDLHKKHFNIEV